MKKSKKKNQEPEPIEEEDDDNEYISLQEAANIWLSSGFDEDSMFGYTEEELRSKL